MAHVDEHPVEKKVSKYIATYKTVIEAMDRGEEIEIEYKTI